MGSMATTTRFRWLWWVVAYVSLGLGLVGIVVPVLPTVPFILLAAFAAARGSEKLHARLLSDSRLGPMFLEWQEHGAISRRAKILATVMMAFCAILLFVITPKLWVPIAVTVIMATVCTWLWLRPEPDGH
ncbi:YbaN family protein [Gordonia caeni]|uniref:YbaN family protein n=2 Tax=Gordonia caeni TaxID=1007097 RepID=A0ABP7P1S2_9ACTN